VSDALGVRLREQYHRRLTEVGINSGRILMWDAAEEAACVVTLMWGG
jgi:hypothetical protein